MAAKRTLSGIVAQLRTHYGDPQPPLTTDPFELILLENVAYLVSGERRAEAFKLLSTTVGTKPHEILAGRKDALLRVAKHGGVHRCAINGFAACRSTSAVRLALPVRFLKFLSARLRLA